VRTPASAQTIMLLTSSSRIFVMRSSDIEMPPFRGMLPPVRPVAAPRGVTGMLCSLATARIFETSSVVAGRTTSSGLLAGNSGTKDAS